MYQFSGLEVRVFGLRFRGGNKSKLRHIQMCPRLPHIKEIGDRLLLYGPLLSEASFCDLAKTLMGSIHLQTNGEIVII